MRFHDGYLRRTPFELAFEPMAGAEGLPEAVRQEARERGVDARDLQAFLSLECVNRFLRGVQEPRSGADLLGHGAFVYQGVHFADPGRAILLVPAATARALTGPEWLGTEPTLPAPSGYLQLPRHLFWVRSGTEGAGEPVDGWFWTLSGSGDLTTLLIAGLREGRPGFSAVPLPEAPWSEAASWTTSATRPGGRDFEPTLPGGDLDGLLSLEAAGEILKLTARVFAHSADAGRRMSVAPGAVEAGGEGPTPSNLSYSRVEP